MKYIYQARSKEGKIETGTVEASSKETAALLLQKYNIVVTSIKPIGSAIFQNRNIAFFERVSAKDLAIFSTFSTIFKTFEVNKFMNGIPC